MNTPNEKTWKEQLPGCFGIVDLKFARHPFDEERAKKMMRAAHNAGATSEDIIAAIHDYLVSKGARQEHIDEEMKYVKKVVA